jgi:hypothetical protein
MQGSRSGTPNAAASRRATSAIRDHVASRTWLFHGQTKCSDHVPHVDEITLLGAIFEYERRLAVHEARSEIGKHARVGIGKGLTGAEDVEDAEGDRLHRIDISENQRALFLDVFCQSVDRCQINVFRLVGADRGNRAPVARDGIPEPGLQASPASSSVLYALSLLREIEAFAIDTHRRGNDEARYRPLDEGVEKDRHAEIICAHIAADLVHALADADFGCKMKNTVHSVERRIDKRSIPDVTLDEFDVRRKRPGAAGSIREPVRSKRRGHGLCGRAAATPRIGTGR